MQFNYATIHATYRLLTRGESGRMIVLGAGSEEAKGFGNTYEDATARGHKALAVKMVPMIQEKMAQFIKGAIRKVEVRFDAVSGIGDNFSLKEMLRNIVWVNNVEDKGIGSFDVTYQENPIYLANSIDQKGRYRIESYSPSLIVVRQVK